MNAPGNHLSTPHTSSLSEKLERLLTTEKDLARQMRQKGARQQRAVVSRISEILQYDRKEVLWSICTHLAQKGKLQSAVSYAEMYMSEGNVDSNELAHILQEILSKAYANSHQEEGEYTPVTMPKWLFRIANKLEKNEEHDVNGALSLIQGRIIQIFGHNNKEAIEKYELALKKNHPAVYYPLGLALLNDGLQEEWLDILLRGWQELADLDCLQEYVRNCFIYQYDVEGYQYYQILQEMDPTAPHIVQLLPNIQLPTQLPLLEDYVKKLHFQEVPEVLDPYILSDVLKWFNEKLLILNGERQATKTLIEQTKWKDWNTSPYDEEFHRLSLEALDLMQLGAVYLLDKPLALTYLRNILSLIEYGPAGMEILSEHILRSEPYARLFVDTIQMVATPKKDEDTVPVPKTEGYFYLERTAREEPKEQSDGNYDPVIDEIMGILDMILYHSQTRDDTDILDLYQEISEKLIGDVGMATHIDTLAQDLSIENSVYINMPKSLQDWHKELSRSIDAEAGIFVRKKIEWYHRSGGIPFEPNTTKYTILFSICDGFMTNAGTTTLDAYIEKLDKFDITHQEGLHLCHTCFHFKEEELAFELICGDIVDWSDPETLFLALRLIYAVSDGNMSIAKECISEIEPSIRQQWYAFENFETFLFSRINAYFEKDEDPENKALLYELSGLGNYLYGDMEQATEYLQKSHEYGSTTAMSHLSYIYYFHGDYEQWYQALRSVYDPQNPESLLDTTRLADLAIANGHREEIPEFLATMEQHNLMGTPWIRFFSLVTGSPDEEMEGIRLLGTYDAKTREFFDSEIIHMVEERIEKILRDKWCSIYERLSWLRTQSVVRNDIPRAVEYWQSLQNSIQKEEFPQLFQHLDPFTDQDYATEIIRGDLLPEEHLRSQVQIGVAGESSFFYAQFRDHPDFPILADAIMKTFELLPECSWLFQDYQKEVQETTTPEHAFELWYDLGKFWEQPTLH